MRAAIAVVALALVLRVGPAMTLPAAIVWEDGVRYDRIAHNLLERHTFGSLQDNARSVPAQPVFLAAVDAVTHDSARAARVASAILGALTCGVIVLLGRRLFGARAGIIAGVLMAVYPLYVYLSALFEYPQTLFLLLVSLSFLLLVRTPRRWWAIASSALLWGIAALTVPTVLPLAVLLALWLPATQPSRAAWWGAALFVIVALVPVGAWAARNQRAYHSFVLVNCATGFNLWKGNNATYERYGKKGVELAEGQSPDPRYPFFAELREVDRAAARYPPERSPIVHDAICLSKGVAFIRADPLRFVRLTLRKAAQLLSPVPDVAVDNTQMSPLRTTAAVASYVPVLLLAVIGVWQERRRWLALAPLLAYVVVLIAAYAVLLPTTRYRLSLDVVFILFAAATLDRWIGGSRRRPA